MHGIARWLLPLAVLGATTGSAASSQPPPLDGSPLRGPTGLRLLVADDRPFLLEVDGGRVTQITGLALAGSRPLAVLAVGRDAVVRVHRAWARGAPRADIYVVRRGATKATRLAGAWEVAPSADGRAVWLKSFRAARHCTLRALWLDGRVRRRARSVSCSMRLVDFGTGALLAQRSSVVDPRTGQTLLRFGGILAIAGPFALTARPRPDRLGLTDLRTGKRWRLRSPSEVGGPRNQGGIDGAEVDPRGKRIAITSSDPAWQGGGTQVTDVWLLDPATRRFQHLPDMPAAVSLKFTSMSWTGDGQLVMLAETERRDVVAVWRPGQNRLAVRHVTIPERNGGSDSFVVWRAR